jgi:hypothetical protein
MDDAWEQRVYDEVFDTLCRQIEKQRQEDPRFSLDDLEGLLESQYIYQGNDWVGRGRLADLRTSATIAAYEHCLAEWRKNADR